MCVCQICASYSSYLLKGRSLIRLASSTILRLKCCWWNCIVGNIGNTFYSWKDSCTKQRFYTCDWDYMNRCWPQEKKKVKLCGAGAASRCHWETFTLCQTFSRMLGFYNGESRPGRYVKDRQMDGPPSINLQPSWFIHVFFCIFCSYKLIFYDATVIKKWEHILSLLKIKKISSIKCTHNCFQDISAAMLVLSQATRIIFTPTQ